MGETYINPEEFKSIKDKYNTYREKERILIGVYLGNKECDYYGLTREGKKCELTENIMKRNSLGKGISTYGKKRSDKQLNPPYDLTNWKYVEVNKKYKIDNDEIEVHYFISLQTFERDPNSNNVHVLMDRIGIYAYVGKYHAEEAINNMKITDIALPLDNDKLEKLCEILNSIGTKIAALEKTYNDCKLV